MIGVSTILPLLAWLFDATLKGSIVIVLIAVAQRVIGRRVDARWRHALWLVVVVRLALPVAPSSSWSIFNLLPAQGAVPLQMRVTVEPAAIPAVLASSHGEVLITSPPSLDRWRWIAAIWICGVLALLLRALIATLRTHLALRRALAAGPLISATTLLVVERARRQLGIARQVRVVESDFVKAPALHGLVRPTLLLPPGMTVSFDRDELRHVVLHELWHVRRLDVAVNWLLAAVQAFHWFNPFVWFAVSRIQEERELACDELALSCLEQEERLGYGRTILKLLEGFRAATPVPALVGIVNHKQKMKRRLTMIATFRNRSRFSILFVAGISVIGALGLTDARGGERHMIRKFDPAAARSIERLHQRVTFDLTNASFGELLNAVSNKTGVEVKQSADLATSRVQQARFTIHADNVPVHAVLMESLMPFQLAPEPDANGVTIVSGPSCMMTMHGDVSHSGQLGTIERKIVIKEGAHAEGSSQEIEVGPEGSGEQRIVIRKTGPAECKITPDGKLHRELTLNIEENGVKSVGKLVLDITGAAEKSK